MTTGAFKAALDERLRRFALENPNLCRPGSPYAWLTEAFAPPGAVRIPLYRMAALPAPFRANAHPVPQ